MVYSLLIYFYYFYFESDIQFNHANDEVNKNFITIYYLLSFIFNF